ncbi:hypothetical protein [Halpernia sp.]|uniref:hypothetical protein n=1 Tax=Halpernia sp. TaxID=2782209 RepID=UPI003A947988
MELDINIRKIDLAKRILNLKDEFLIKNLENLLKENTSKNDLVSMSLEEFYERIEQSEKDFAAGRFVTSEELLKEFR